MNVPVLPRLLFMGFGDIQRSLGARVYLSALLDALRASGHDVHALFLQQRLPGLSDAGDFRGSLVAVGLPMRGAPDRLPRGIWRGFEFLWAGRRGLAFALAGRRRCQTCLVTGVGLLPLLPVLRRWYPTVVYIQHGILEESQPTGGVARTTRYRLFKILERLFLPLADLVIVVSNQMAEYCRTLYGVERSVVVPCCVDLARFSCSPETRADMRRTLGLEDRLVLVYSGGAASWQCVEQSVRLFQAVRAAFPHAFLLVLSADTTAWRHALRGVAPGASRAIGVAHADVGRYLCAADVALLLRRRSLINAVASPVKFAEYLACGLPVITSPFVGDCSAMVRDRRIGLLVDPDDESTWPGAISALAALVQDPDTAMRCRDAARGLSWNVVAESLSRALRDARRPARAMRVDGRVHQHAHQ